jgi:hypothetical protein
MLFLSLLVAATVTLLQILLNEARIDNNMTARMSPWLTEVLTRDTN